MVTHLLQLLEPVIILQEESQVHKGHINVTVASVLPVLFNGVPASREGVLVNLKQHQELML